MTDDERFIIRLNIANYQAMLKLDIDDKSRSAVERLLIEAGEVLATDFKEQRSRALVRERRRAGAVDRVANSVSGVLR